MLLTSNSFCIIQNSGHLNSGKTQRILLNINLKRKFLVFISFKISFLEQMSEPIKNQNKQ